MRHVDLPLRQLSTGATRLMPWLHRGTQHGDMSFNDLPENWTLLPLDTPGLAADVVDLVLTIADRHQNCLLVEMCNADGIGYPSPIKIPHLHWTCSAGEREEIMTSLAQVAAQFPQPAPNVLLALSSPHPLPETVVDAWHSTVQSALSDVNCQLLGFYTSTPQEVVEVSA